jgi:DNA-directed RNA polymerase sigma subunit (sigma70/sigma32)
MRAVAIDRVEELPKRLGISRQRVHQLKLRALRKLRERLRPE